MPRNSKKKQCRSYQRQTKERCQQWAIRGGEVCYRHGGNLPSVRAKANRTLEKEKVMSELQKMRDKGLLSPAGVDQHPLDHLLDELYLSAGVAQVLGEMVGDLEKLDQYGGENSGREPHVLMAMWQQERGFHAKLAEMALRAGVAERQVQLAERQAELMAKAIREILKDLGVADHPQAPAIVRRHLMALSPPKPSITVGAGVEAGVVGAVVGAVVGEEVVEVEAVEIK